MSFLDQCRVAREQRRLEIARRRKVEEKLTHDEITELKALAEDNASAAAAARWTSDEDVQWWRDLVNKLERMKEQAE